MADFFAELWMILRESSVWLIFGFMLAGLVHAFVPRDLMLKHLGSRGLGSVVKASLLGIPMPLCSCSVIPVASGLRRGGASKGASAAFAISTPQTGEESIPLTWGLFGPVYAFTRPVVAVLTALTAGVLINLTGRDDESGASKDTAQEPKGSCCSSTPEPASSCCSSKPEPAPVSSCCSHTAEPTSGDCCSSTPPKGDVSLNVLAPVTKPRFGQKIGSALGHGFGTMLKDLALWLTIGIVLAALIGALVPTGWIEEHAGTGIVPKLAMLVVGIPLYICATSSTPLAYSLVVAGLSPGAALVLLLAGPATNTATMSWLIKDLGIRSLVIYLVTIALFALGAGVAFDALLAQSIVLADHGAHAHEHGAGAWGVVKDVSAVGMIVLLAWALGMKMNGWLVARGVAPQKSAGGSCCSTKGSSKSTASSSCGCSH